MLEQGNLERLDQLIKDNIINFEIYRPSEKLSREYILENLNSTSGPSANGGIADRILIMPPKDNLYGDEAVDHVKEQINKIIEIYNRDPKHEKINQDEVKGFNGTTESIIISKYANGNGYAVLTIYKNGSANVIVKDIDEKDKGYVTGVFSEDSYGENFNEYKARKWLSNTLGIDQANVIVIDAILRSMSDGAVYGVTNVCSDALVGGLTGYIMLSRQGGMGVTYHEAFHYVNLLMHNNRERRQVYKSFLKTHKYLDKEGTTIREVEEALADEFARYVEAKNDKSLTGRIKRLYNNILDFLSITRRKSIYRNVFKQIQKGGYAKTQLDQSSLREFHNKYVDGVNKLAVKLPGVPSDISEEMNFDRYQQYYEVFESVTNRLKQRVNVSTMNDLLQYTKDNKLDDVIDMIKEMRDELNIEDTERIQILNTLINNRFLIKKILKESFLNLGFKLKVKRVKDLSTESSVEEEGEDATAKEDNPDNSWDKVDLTFSKKQNAALETKIFFSTIPDYLTSTNRDGTVSYKDNYDRYCVQKMWDFDQAWNLLLGELFSATSFDAKDADGNYLKSSIMGKVESLKDSSKFWYAVDQKFQSLLRRRNNTKLKS
uniref:Uncharacterized protein n=1 Tax=Dulem virus 42 TaxID=3145760 RepID=A0AAU8BAZ0_9CAUD